jgi:hypothetical protein
MTTLHVLKHHDPGHGWVEVSFNLLQMLGIRDAISPSSHMRGRPFGTSVIAYLEEDCDAPLSSSR